MIPVDEDIRKWLNAWPTWGKDAVDGAETMVDFFKNHEKPLVMLRIDNEKDDFSLIVSWGPLMFEINKSQMEYQPENKEWVGFVEDVEFELD